MSWVTRTATAGVASVTNPLRADRASPAKRDARKKKPSELALVVEDFRLDMRAWTLCTVTNVAKTSVGLYAGLARQCVVALRYGLTQRVPSKHSPAGHSQILTS